MRVIIAGLLISAAFGLRRRGTSGIQVTSEMDASGRWNAKARPDMFTTQSLTVALPGGEEIHFDCQPSVSMLADAEGAQVQSCSTGLAQLSALKRSTGHIAGSIVDPKTDMVHKFSGMDGQELNFVSIPSSDFPDDGEPTEAVAHEMGNANVTRASHGIRGQSNTMSVLVLWTRDAECRNAGSSAGCSQTDSTLSSMETMVNLATFETNSAFTDSGINAQIQVAAWGRVDASYQPTDFNGALNDITSDSGIASWRQQFAADLVVLLIDDPQYCGLAWIGPQKSKMFSVTAWNCATGYYSFGHEIAHNLGCQHDLGTTGACSTNSYNYGWRDPNAAFRTVMSYNCRTDQCDGISSSGCTRVPRFSNPSLSYSGRATGSSRANNARQINNVAATVAAYY